jgi:hypothetical protein
MTKEIQNPGFDNLRNARLYLIIQSIDIPITKKDQTTQEAELSNNKEVMIRPKFKNSQKMEYVKF